MGWFYTVSISFPIILCHAAGIWISNSNPWYDSYQSTGLLTGLILGEKQCPKADLTDAFFTSWPRNVMSAFSCQTGVFEFLMLFNAWTLQHRRPRPSASSRAALRRPRSDLPAAGCKDRPGQRRWGPTKELVDGSNGVWVVMLCSMRVNEAFDHLE